MTDAITVDAARLPLLLGELRLPTIGALWLQFTERADREGWPATRLLATLAELELAERSQRRIQRHLAEARLPPGKTLDSFEFNAVPMVNKAQITALAAGDGWLEKGANILLFGPSGPCFERAICWSGSEPSSSIRFVGISVSMASWRRKDRPTSNG